MNYGKANLAPSTARRDWYTLESVDIGNGPTLRSKSKEVKLPGDDVGVVIVVIAGFGGVRHALLANLVLLIGTGWAFGYATFAVGLISTAEFYARQGKAKELSRCIV